MSQLYRRPTSHLPLTTEPQLASWEHSGHATKLRLSAFLAHAEAIASSAMYGGGALVLELVVGLPDDTMLDTGGRDLDNYLLPLVSHLGHRRFAAVFGRKVHGSSSLAIEPAVPAETPGPPQLVARMTGSYEREDWKRGLRDHLIRQAAGTNTKGPLAMTVEVTTGERNWLNLWKPLIDSFGPVLGEDLARPYHPRDDRIVDLALHHAIDLDLRHDVVIHAWWQAAVGQ